MNKHTEIAQRKAEDAVRRYNELCNLPSEERMKLMRFREDVDAFPPGSVQLKYSGRDNVWHMKGSTMDLTGTQMACLGHKIAWGCVKFVNKEAVAKQICWASEDPVDRNERGGYATRQLYTDDEEALFDAMRPIALNGIESLIERQDLADRCLLVQLEPITKDKRRTDQDLKQAFNQARPGILGALLDAAAHGLRTLPNTKVTDTPRMADFATWAVACESAPCGRNEKTKPAGDVFLSAGPLGMQHVVPKQPTCRMPGAKNQISYG
jgi:hypothetical protein